MSIDNIQLSRYIIGEWYKDALLASPDAPAAIEAPAKPQPANPAAESPKPVVAAKPELKPEPPGYKFLGNNRRHVAIIVQSPGIAFLPDNQLTFLTKILEACRMNIGDVAIINAATAPINITELKQQLKPASVLFFGLEPTAIKLPINFPEFRLQPYDDCTYLVAPALDQLVKTSEESKLLKSKLWVCLKTLFNV